jgi:hypothetical protein
MNAAALPPPAPGQTYQDYVNAAVLAAAERGARWKAGQGPPQPPELPRAAAAAHRPSLLDVLDGSAS